MANQRVLRDLGLVQLALLGFLIAGCADRSTPASTLQKAVEDNDIDQVKLLLNAGTDVNAKDRDGATAIHMAAFHGHTEMVELLLDRGADVNAQTHDIQATALHAAALGGHAPTAQALLDRGAQVDAEDDKGHTPMFYAQKGPADLTDLLRRYGANDVEPLAGAGP